jgi:hypothetical protein
MRFVSIDLELNQPSNNIIQIGACTFNTDSKTPYVPEKTLSVFIDPNEPVNWNHHLNTRETLGSLLGDTFKTEWEIHKVSTEEGLVLFWDFIKNSQSGRKVIQWGNGDIQQILNQSKIANVRPSIIVKDLNIKRVYELLYKPILEKNKGGGLFKACENMGVPFEGRAHDALVDAINTGKLTVKMFEILSNYQKIKKLTEK